MMPHEMEFDYVVKDLHVPEGFSSKLAQKDHLKNLLTSLQSMRNNKVLTDFTIVCKNGEEINVHRLILMSASPYFRDSSDNSITKVKFRNIDANEMNIAIAFMYSGQIVSQDTIKKNVNRLKRLVLAAHELELSSLIKWCLHHLSQTLNFTNYNEVLKLALLCKNEGLVSRIFTYLAKNFTQLVDTKSIADLGIEQLKRILQHPELVDVHQDDLLKAILEWIQGNAIRKDQLFDLVEEIDLSQLTKDYLSYLLLASTPIKENHQVLASLACEAAKRMNTSSNQQDRPIGSGRKLICFGQDSKNKVMNIYDLRSHEWLTPAKIPPFDIGQGRCAVGFGNFIYIFGGLGCDTKSSTCIIKYSPYINEADNNVGSLIVPVNLAGAVLCNDSIYIINGITVGENAQKSVQRYDPRKCICWPVSPTNVPHKLPQGFSSGISLYVFGTLGSNDNIVEQYDTIIDQWTTVTRFPGPIEFGDRTATLCGVQLFVNNVSDQTHFHIWNLKSREWSVKEIQSVGPVLRMWSAAHDGKQVILARTNWNTFHAYAVETGQWATKSKPSYDPSAWFLTCLI